MKTLSPLLKHSRSILVASSIVALSLAFSACTKSKPNAVASDALAAMSDAVGTSGSSDDTGDTGDTGGTGDTGDTAGTAGTAGTGVTGTDGNVTAAGNEVVDQLVLTVGGGFTTWQSNVGELPIAFIADGQLIRGLPSDRANELAPKATTQEIQPAALEEIASWLYGAGFKGDPLDFGDPGVTDMPSTTLTFTIGGEFYRQSAYALDFDTSGSGTTLTDEQQKNRANFSRLVEFLKDPVAAYGAANLTTPTSYVPATYSLWGRRYGVPVSANGDAPPKLVKVPWPHASISLASFEEQPSCVPVEEADSVAVAATFAAAAAPGVSAKVASAEFVTTAFAQPDGVVSELVLTPVLPGMMTCPEGEPFRIFGDPK
jgi:hypothetical protein